MRSHSDTIAAHVLALGLALALAGLWAAAPAAAQQVRPNPSETARPAATPTPTPTPTPSSRPVSPLPAASPTPEGADDDEDNAIAGAGNNWLSRNGLSSPLCGRQAGGAGLDPSARRVTRDNCAGSGIASSPYSPDQLGFDIHIDTGFAGLSKNSFALLLQQLLAGLWNIILNITQALISALEWAFALDLLNPSALGSIATNLKQLEQVFTIPAIRIVMGLTAVWIAYHALVRNRVRFVAGETARMFGLLAVALLVLANPISTVGWLNRTANDAAIGTIGVLSMPADALLGHRAGSAQATYEDGLQGVYEGLAVRPWALLEFGDVDWATNPQRLDPELKATARKLSSGFFERKLAPDLSRRVDAARTNGELWLAWPAQHPARNSVKDKISRGEDLLRRVSLYRALCGNDDDNECKGPNAARAEARTESGTWSRMAQLGLILLGMAPMWVLLAVIAFMLIGASVMALLHLIQLAVIAPIAVLGWGNGAGRFTNYLQQFLGALFAKFAYAIVLGLVLNLYRILTSLDGIGFVMQWLLVAIGVFEVIRRRKTAWGMLRNTTRHGELGERATHHVRRTITRAATYRAAGLPTSRNRRYAPSHTPPSSKRGRSTAPGTGAATAQASAPSGQHARATAPSGQDTREAVGRQAHNVLRGAMRHAIDTNEAGARSHDALTQRRDRLAEEASSAAAAAAAATTPRARKATRRRELSLARRQSDVTDQLAAQETARRTAGRARSVRRDGRFDASTTANAERFLLDQAGRRRGQAPSSASKDAHRDYPRLAGLVNSTAGRYSQATPADQLRMRARIDRELDHRTGPTRRAVSRARGGAGAASRETASNSRSPRDGARPTPRPQAADRQRRAAVR